MGSINMDSIFIGMLGRVNCLIIGTVELMNYCDICFVVACIVFAYLYV